MTELTTILEQAKLFVSQHAPPEVVTKGIPLAIVMLLAGISTSVLGAKLARWALTGAFAIAGGIVGAQCSQITSLHPALCAAVGAVAIGTIGYLTFRIWAGVVSAVVISAIALGIFGYQRVRPLVGEFEGRAIVAESQGAGTFTLPTPEQQESYLDRTPQQWANEFWSFATNKDARLQPDGQAVAIVAMLTGLLFGLLATRAALILATSFGGTAIVATAAGMLTAHFAPGFYDALLAHPQYAGAGVGAFLLSSIVLQALVTRKGTAAPAPARP